MQVLLCHCQALFGRHLHHIPYFGCQPDGVRLLQTHFRLMDDLYVEEFGESILSEELLADLKAVAESCSGTTN